MTRLDDDRAAIHLWQLAGGEPVSFQSMKDHIRGCEQCCQADPGRCWFIMTAWHRSIDASHIRGQR